MDFAPCVRMTYRGREVFIFLCDARAFAIVIKSEVDGSFGAGSEETVSAGEIPGVEERGRPIADAYAVASDSLPITISA